MPYSTKAFLLIGLSLAIPVAIRGRGLISALGWPIFLIGFLAIWGTCYGSFIETSAHAKKVDEG